MVVMMPMPGVRHVQTALRAATGLILHLHRNMFNLILMLQEVEDPVQKTVVIVRRYHLHVQRHHRFFSYQPGMNVVYVANFRYRAAQIAF